VYVDATKNAKGQSKRK